MQKVESALDESAPQSPDRRPSPHEADLTTFGQDRAVDNPDGEGWQRSPIGQIAPVYRRSLFRR